MKLIKRISPISTRLAAAIFLALLCSCSFVKKQEDKPDIDALYSELTRHHDQDTVPVIVIPGIFGSNLKDSTTGKSAWGAFYGDFLKPSSDEGIKALAVTPQPGVKLGDLPSGLEPDGVLKAAKFKFLGIPIQAQAYAKIMRALGIGGYRDPDLMNKNSPDYGNEHFTCFQFAYDWRLSNAKNAARLDAFIKDKQIYVRNKIKQKYGVTKKDIKFNIIAHSMGGLVSRYYARYGSQQLPDNGLPKLTWAGAKNLNKLIIVSTPNSGSIIALEDLVHGKSLAPSWVKNVTGIGADHYPSELVGTYPSGYELLTRKRNNTLIDQNGKSLDPLSYELWEKNKWGLAGADIEKLRNIMPSVTSDEELHSIAKDHLKKCLANARKFHKALDVKPQSKPEHFRISLFVGDALPTVSQLKLGNKPDEFIRNEFKPGDWTVLRSSVLADQNAGNGTKSQNLETSILFDNVTFVFDEHLKMTEDASFLDNMLFELLQR